MMSRHSNAFKRRSLETCLVFIIVMTAIICWAYTVSWANTVSPNPASCHMLTLSFARHTGCDEYKLLYTTQILILTATWKGWSIIRSYYKEKKCFFCYKRNPSTHKLPLPRCSAGNLVHPIPGLNIRWGTLHPQLPPRKEILLCWRLSQASYYRGLAIIAFFEQKVPIWKRLINLNWPPSRLTWAAFRGQLPGLFNMKGRKKLKKWIFNYSCGRTPPAL